MSFRLFAMVFGGVIAPLLFALAIALGGDPARTAPPLPITLLIMLSVVGGLLVSYLGLAPIRRKLRRLTLSMRAIGEGDSPGWLPLPEGDVVEDLSVATGEMVARVQDLVRTVDEQGRLAVVGELASHIAHEIRNPLSSIHMNLQSIDRLVARGSIGPDMPEMIQVSLQEVRRLNAVVGSVLEMGEATPPTFEECSLHEIVRGSLELMEPEFRRSRIAVDWRPEAVIDRVLADPGRIRSVLLNLFVNALDAQPSGGALRMTSSVVLEMNGPALRLIVQDSGPGIPTADQGRIFRPFFTTKPGGSGIGLAMSREAMRAHGGDLEFDQNSSQGRGAAFRLVLPIAPAAMEGFDRDWLADSPMPVRRFGRPNLKIATG